jgi:hypothetical protein
MNIRAIPLKGLRGEGMDGSSEIDPPPEHLCLLFLHYLMDT